MDPKLWKQIKDSYASAMEVENPAGYLAGLEPDVRSHVERLLDADSEAGDFIAKPFLVERGSVALEESPDAVAVEGYTIISTIGTGGMGTVHLAERLGEGFTQRVALKLIKSGMGTDLVLRRFLVERQILAGLDHPNIARMLDGGSTADGLPYFVMEYVNGSPLREYCDGRYLDTRARVVLFAKVCDAVSYAHQKLVVHRDIKPSNIIVDEKGEPKLLDFGIAKLLAPDWQTSAETVTATQFRTLTPEYASPEQLRGESTTTLTDVYSLGVVLYELLTGIRPFHDDGRNPAALATLFVRKNLEGLRLSLSSTLHRLIKARRQQSPKPRTVQASQILLPPRAEAYLILTHSGAISTILFSKRSAANPDRGISQCATFLRTSSDIFMACR